MLNKILYIFLFFAISLFAEVRLNLPQKAIVNEAYTFSIEAIGNNIKFPKLLNIDGNIVQEVSTSNATNIINSKITKKIKKTYTMYPKSDFTFPSLQFEIDGKEEFTTEKKVLLEVPSKTKSNFFDLEIKSSKDKLYVGENFVLTIILKFRRDIQIVDMAFQNPNFKDFWFKQLNDTKRYNEDEYEVQELKFMLIPLKDGKIKVPPLSILAQIVDVNNSRSFSMFSNITKDIKIYSNELSLDVNKLPQGVKLIGDFKIETSIDKERLNIGEAVSYKLRIEGIGNIEDIPEIKLDIPNVTIYENKPNIVTKIKDNELTGSYEKVFSIVPNSSITIPPVNIKYLDKNSLEIKELKTKEYNIEVINTQSSQQNFSKLEKNVSKEVKKDIVKVVKEVSIVDKITYFIMGILVSLFAFGIYFYIINKKRNKEVYNTPLIKKIKSSKTKDELLKIMAIYININSDLDNLIFQLEKSENIRDIKKDIEKKLKELKL